VAFLALIGVGSAASSTARNGFFQLSRLNVNAQGRVLLFSVAVSRVPLGDRATLAWSLAPIGGAACENLSFPDGTRSRNGLVVWDEQGPTFRWDRGRGRCAGTVSVVAENQYEHCTAKAIVTLTKVMPAKPACALGGYEIGFSTLPVPVGVFQAYSQVHAGLSGPPRSAAATADQIQKLLRAQSGAFRLFPPVWFCDFARTFMPVVALSADLSRNTTVLAERDARVTAAAFGSCAPASVRAALAQLASSSKPQARLLASMLERYFPPVFGFRYADLVARVAAEDVALAEAEAAAAAGKPGAAAEQIAIAGRSVDAISRSLDNYQRRVERVENANG
jgi:hypothetical protein